MEPSLIFALVMAFSWTAHLWELYLSWRQYRKYVETESVPEEVSEVMDAESFRKSRAYRIDRARYGFVSSIYHQIQDTVVLTMGALPWLWAYCGELARGLGYGSEGFCLLLELSGKVIEMVQSSIFLVLGTVASTVLDMPWKLYDTFVLEQKHGFNKQTLGFFAKDQVKKLVVVLALMVPITDAVIWIIQATGDNFFLYLWAFTAVITLALLTIYPDFIAPLFDKYTPLPEGALRERIEELADRLHFPLTKLYVMGRDLEVEGSKRSAHSNAYMYGFWNNKRIVLFDTLLAGWGSTEEEKAKGMGNDEVMAVLGHELGHWALYHMLSNLVIVQANNFLIFFVFGFLYRRSDVFAAFGFMDSQPTLIGLMLIFLYIFAPYNEVVTFLVTALTRRMEFAADAFSANLGYAKELSSGLIKLGKDNLSFPVDDWLYSTWHHSHPPIPERIRVMKKWQ